MEDVWQEIELSSLPDRPRPGGPMASASFHTSGPPALSLQDFLAQPFHRDINNDNHLSHHLSTADSFISAFPRPPPVTVLSLVSRSDSMSSFPSGPVSNKIRANAPQFHARGSPCNPFKNRPAPPVESGDDHFEQKRLRLMKNRESAARCRARKQVCFIPSLLTVSKCSLRFRWLNLEQWNAKKSTVLKTPLQDSPGS